MKSSSALIYRIRTQITIKATSRVRYQIWGVSDVSFRQVWNQVEQQTWNQVSGVRA